jgi:C4-dicarboxylate-binding protein DctP
MADHVREATGGQLVVTSNPGGTVHPGADSINAVKSGKAEMTFVNAGNLESVDSQLGVINLPFTLDDASMGLPETRRLVVDLLDRAAMQHGMRLITLMRGTDAIFVFPGKPASTLREFAGLRIRIASGGISSQVVERLGAKPLILPIPFLKAAFDRGELDGVFTSPGAWSSQLGMLAPNAMHVPGLMMVTYALLARSDVVDQLAASDRAVLFDAASLAVLDNWNRMADDDRALLDTMKAKGADILTISDASEIRDAVDPITVAFAQRHPEMWNRFRPIMESRQTWPELIRGN